MERQFLVQRKDCYDGDEWSSIMTEGELIHYIDMLDLVDECCEIYETTTMGKVVPLHYVGWQPGCLIEVANEEGEVVLRGYGTDH